MILRVRIRGRKIISLLFTSGGRLPYKSDRNALHLTLGCKLQILVSLRVFGMESYYFCPFRCRLVLCIKKFTKNALTLSTQKSSLGVSLSSSHTHICLPYGFNFNFPTSIPVTFMSESPPGVYLTSSHFHFNLFDS